MARAVLMTGGNRGDMHGRLAEALHLLGERAGRITAVSGIYRSAAWGFEADDFYNQAVELETALEPLELLDTVQEIERLAGRDRTAEKAEKEASGARYASRTLDIDILFYDDLVLESERLTIPHPRIAERMFVLEPLCEIDPDRVHPLTGKTIKEMRIQLGIRN